MTAAVTTDPGPDRPEPARPDPVDADAPEVLRVPVPAWLEIGLLFVATVAVCCGGFGLALAVAGHYSATLALGVGLPLAVVLTGLGAIPLVGRHDRRPDRRGGQAPAVTAVLFAAVSAVVNAWRSGDWIVIDRDAGVYAVTAKWLTDHDSLSIPFQAQWGGSGLPVTGSTLGVYEEASGNVEFQFNHLLPVLLAQVGHLFGDRAMLDSNAVVVAAGLLAVYVAGVRLIGRPWIVLAAVVGLGVSLPMIYVSRATWSEGITMLLVWTGAWLLVTAWDRRSVVLAVLGGLTLGGSVMGRIDALVYLAPIPLIGAVLALHFARDDRWRRFTLIAVGALVGAVVPVVVGTLDVEVRAGFYYRDLAAQIGLLQKATLAAAVVGVVVLVLARPLRRVVGAVHGVFAPRAAVIAGVCGVLATLLVVFAWALRPVLDHPRGSVIPLVGGLQAREGVPVDPTRSYSEQGVVWVSWYLGVPAVALAAAGLGLLVRRAVLGRPAAVGVLATVGAGALFYLYQLSNTPDQLFGVRRFVPAVLPLFALGAAAALGTLAVVLPKVFGRSLARWWRPVVGVAMVALVAFPLGTSAPLRDLSQHRGLLGAVDRLCAQLGPDAAVVFPDPTSGQVVAPQTIRSWCNVPVAGVTRTASLAELEAAAGFWAVRGRTLWVVDTSQTTLAKVFDASWIQQLASVATDYDPTLMLTRPPDTYSRYEVTFWGVPVSRATSSAG